MIHAAGIKTYGMIPEGRVKHMLRGAASRINGELSKRYYVNSGDVAVQVGTPSVGTVRYLIDLVGPQGHVVVIEPEAANFRRLSEDPVIAGGQNVTLLNKGAWSSRGKLLLTVSKEEADHKIAVEGVIHDNDLVPGNYVGTQEIEVDTVDNMLEEVNCSKVDFVEIMVNGAELEVLKGMPRVCQQRVRLRIKAHAKLAESGEDIGQQIFDLLETRGFRTVRARQTAARKEAVGWGGRAGDIYAARF